MAKEHRLSGWSWHSVSREPAERHESYLHVQSNADYFINHNVVFQCGIVVVNTMLRFYGTRRKTDFSDIQLTSAPKSDSCHILTLLQLLDGEVGAQSLRAGAVGVRKMLGIDAEAVGGVADAVALECQC